MGTSGTGVFSDDVACDVRDQFVALLADGASGAEATESLTRSFGAAIEDCEDGPVFWLALAATAWKYGCMTDQVQQKAIAAIDQGLDLGRWSGASLARRRTALESLKKQLLTPQPKVRRPRRRKPFVVPSTKVLSPDQRALATAYEISSRAAATGPRMQVLVDMVSSGEEGGGGVFVASCEYTQVHLSWLDPETLEISYPVAASVRDRKPSLFFHGRTIFIKYQERAADHEANRP
jgi:hypothetical protein